MLRKTIVAAMLVSALALALAGCASPGPSTSSSSSASSSASYSSSKSEASGTASSSTSARPSSSATSSSSASLPSSAMTLSELRALHQPVIDDVDRISEEALSLLLADDIAALDADSSTLQSDISKLRNAQSGMPAMYVSPTALLMTAADNLNDALSHYKAAAQHYANGDDASFEAEANMASEYIEMAAEDMSDYATSIGNLK